MAEEGRGVALAILGIVAVIAVVGLVLLFTGATGKFAGGGPGMAKLYTRQSQVGYGAGPADVENPYYGYEYETYAGLSQSRYATGKDWSAGGAWDPGGVYGESPYDAASEPGMNAAPDARYSPTYKRAPSRVPSGQNDYCGFCPYGSQCVDSEEQVPTGAESVPGYPGCYFI